MHSGGRTSAPRSGHLASNWQNAVQNGANRGSDKRKTSLALVNFKPRREVSYARDDRPRLVGR